MIGKIHLTIYCRFPRIYNYTRLVRKKRSFRCDMNLKDYLDIYFNIALFNRIYDTLLQFISHILSQFSDFILPEIGKVLLRFTRHMKTYY